MEILSNVNWIAVGVGTVASFLVGWAWFSPILFGVKWAEGSRVDLGTADQMPIFAMVSQLVALFLLATVIGLTALTNDLVTAIVAILAMATFSASNGGFVQKSNYAIAVDFSYAVVVGCVMIACQGIL